MCIQDKVLLGYLQDIYDIKRCDITTNFLESIKQININQSINYNDLLLFKNLEEFKYFKNNLEYLAFNKGKYGIINSLKHKKVCFY